MALQTSPMVARGRYGTGKSILPYMSSIILSRETLWSTGTKALTQNQRLDTSLMASGATSCLQQLPQQGCTKISTRRILTPKRAPKLSVKVVSVGQSRHIKWQKTSTTHGPSKGKIELKKYSRHSISTSQRLSSKGSWAPQKAAKL